MDDIKAKAFADALTALCKEYKIMIWTSIPTVPIMATEMPEGDDYYYQPEKIELSSDIIIRRILS